MRQDRDIEKDINKNRVRDIKTGRNKNRIRAIEQGRNKDRVKEIEADQEKDKNYILKRQAGETVVILLENWKKRMWRYRLYRACLLGALAISFASLVGVVYYYVDSSIPSVINVRANQEESFFLGIPAKAEIVSVSDNGSSNIPAGAVEINLNRPVTLKAALESSYQMRVKLFGFLSFKNVRIQVIEDQELIPVGKPIGIYVKTNGVLVVGTGEFQGADGMSYSPGKYILKSGDYICKVDGQDVSEKEDFIRRVENSQGRELELTVERDGNPMKVKLQPERDSNGAYKIGVWVRDNAQGIGTMTYIDSQGNFGALGHGITDVDTSTLMHMAGGTLYQTDIVDVRRGTAGEPGEMTGMIIYSDDRILGNITHNSTQGIFGICNNKALAMGVGEPLPIGLKQEIVEGPAQILCTIDHEPEYYDVRITALHLDHDNVNRGIELTITDPDLLEATGGIVQGMSGSPIIQNGKIIGAVTHVLVQDSAKGYGIFIENMLEY